MIVAGALLAMFVIAVIWLGWASRNADVYWLHHCRELNDAPVDVPDGQDCPVCGKVQP